MYKKLIIIFFFCSAVIAGQGVKLGFRLEPGAVFTEYKGDKDVSPFFYGFKANIMIEPESYWGIEIQPGLMLVNDQLLGFEIGSFAKVNILSPDFALLLGLSNFFNREISGRFSGGYGKHFVFYGVGAGYQVNSKLRLDLMYYRPDTKEYAYVLEPDETGYRKVNKKINGIVRVAFNLAFEIISF